MGRVGVPTPVVGVQGVLTAYCDGKTKCPSWVNGLGKKISYDTGRACDRIQALPGPLLHYPPADASNVWLR